MKIKIIHRPPNDLFTMRLFYRLLRDVKKPADALYMWTMYFDLNLDPLSDINNETYCKREILDTIKNDLVIIGIKDHFTSGWFNPYKEDKPNLVSYFETMFDYYSDKQFIVFVSTEGPIFKNPNVHVINWGGDITNQKFEYTRLEPEIEKNLDSNYSYISLNRNYRHHRTLALSALYGLDLERTGFITYMDRKNIPDSLDNIACKIDTPIKDILDRGFNKLKTAEFSKEDDYQIYPQYNNDNAYNFDAVLRNYYRNTFVEIINETSFTEPCYLLTEKTLNSIYGCNFPILLSGLGAVSFLRNMGLDVFDDVIDHSYDEIADPVQRLFFAIDRNKEILNNSSLAKTLWVKNRDRFIKNIEFAKHGLYDFYQTRAEEQWNKLKNLYDNISK